WPKRVSCMGGTYIKYDEKSPREVPDTAIMTADFPSQHTIVIASVTSNEQGLTPTIRGHMGTMYLNPATPTIEIGRERDLVDEAGEGTTETLGYAGEEHEPHEQNFFECMRSRKQPNCNIDLAAPVMVTLALAEIAIREGRTVHFDGDKLEV